MAEKPEPIRPYDVAEVEQDIEAMGDNFPTPVWPKRLLATAQALAAAQAKLDEQWAKYSDSLAQQAAQLAAVEAERDALVVFGVFFFTLSLHEKNGALQSEVERLRGALRNICPRCARYQPVDANGIHDSAIPAEGRGACLLTIEARAALTPPTKERP